MQVTKSSLAGIYSALPTPSDTQGGVAEKPLAAHVKYLIGQGVAGLVPVGGTGDYPALTPAQRLKAVEVAVSAADGKTPVIPGVLSPGYGETLAAAEDFQRAGAAALMVITPYYVAPSQSGIIDYFRKLRDRLSVPIVLYDIPSRTGTGAQPETLARLAEDGTIIGMKASGTDLYQFNRLAALCGEAMSILSGTDRMMPLHCAMGAKGAVLTTASLFPAYWMRVLSEAASGRVDSALAMQRRLFPLFDVLALEPLPVMLNAALDMLGFDMGPARSPVLPASEKSLAALRKLLPDFIGDVIVSAANGA